MPLTESIKEFVSMVYLKIYANIILLDIRGSKRTVPLSYNYTNKTTLEEFLMKLNHSFFQRMPSEMRHIKKDVDIIRKLKFCRDNASAGQYLSEYTC